VAAKKEADPACAGIGDRRPVADEEATADDGRPGASAAVGDRRAEDAQSQHIRRRADYDPEVHHRAGKKADELFREIVRRAARKE
jgi:hypothetical protein